jgi:hypothetical protein
MITINGIYRPIMAATNASPSTPAPVEDTVKSVFGAQLKQVADSLAAPTPIKTEQSSTAEAPAVPKESTASTAPVTVTAQTTAISSAVKNFMEWQSAQPNPFGQGTISDMWAKQGITDPFNNPVMLDQAQNMLDRASLRAAMNPNYVAEWSGDWKTQMAQAKTAETARQAIIVAGDIAGKVAVGGGVATA